MGHAKAAREPIPDLTSPPWRPPSRSPAASACEPYREIIEDGLGRGRNAKAVWQDLVTEHGFAARYASVQRFARKVRGSSVPEACAVITTEPGEEAQVDYGDGPMVRHPETGKYRRMRLLLMTLGYSRKSVRLLTWRSSELHEKAFRRLGGAPRTTVLDNLREGVLAPDIYDPRLNPSTAMSSRTTARSRCRAAYVTPIARGKSRASGLESRLLQAQAEPLAPIDFISALVSDELLRRGDRLIERRANTPPSATRARPSTLSTSSSTRRWIGASSSSSRPRAL